MYEEEEPDIGADPGTGAAAAGTGAVKWEA